MTLLSPTTTMADLLDQLLAESKSSGGEARDMRRKTFEEAFECVKTTAKCIPDDKKGLAEEKEGWATQWDVNLVRIQLINLTCVG
jgi:hypothetical protein